MRSSTIARMGMLVLVAAGFGLATWHLLSTAPQSTRERPLAPVPLIDVIDSTAGRFPLVLEAAGPVVSAYELEVRPQVGGRIVALHPDFEPGGRIPADTAILQIEPRDYELAVSAAEAEIAKARAAIALEQGRSVVAREELASLQGSVRVDAESRSLALRKPQLRQVQAELAAAENRLQRAELDLTRTRLTLPFDVVVLDRARVAGEIVAARELVGRVARADEYWVELRVQPRHLRHLRARQAGVAGSPVVVHAPDADFDGEIVRIRADLAAGSRLAGVIAAIPVQPAAALRPRLGSYVEATIDAGEMEAMIAVPRRAVHDNRRLWVVDAADRLRVRKADIRWETGQQFLLARDALQPGDRVVVGRVDGLVPGAAVRSRVVTPDRRRPVGLDGGAVARGR